MASHRSELIPQIVSEFSQVFAFTRGRWSHYAEEIHPDLKGVGMMMLQTILRKGAVTATELGQLLTLDKATVSRQVAKLREIGLVAAEPSAEDRRVILLSATAETRAAIDGLQGLTAAAYQERFADWSAGDLAELQRLLHRFNTTAEQGRWDPSSRAAQCAEHAAHAGRAEHVGR